MDRVETQPPEGRLAVTSVRRLGHGTLGCRWPRSAVAAQAKFIAAELPLGKWCYPLALSDNCPDLETSVAPHPTPTLLP